MKTIGENIKVVEFLWPAGYPQVSKLDCSEGYIPLHAFACDTSGAKKGFVNEVDAYPETNSLPKQQPRSLCCEVVVSREFAIFEKGALLILPHLLREAIRQ